MSIPENTHPINSNCFDKARECLPNYTNASRLAKITASIVIPLACVAIIAGAIFVSQGFNLPAGYASLALGSAALIVDTLILVSLFYKKKEAHEEVDHSIQTPVTPQKKPSEPPSPPSIPLDPISSPPEKPVILKPEVETPPQPKTEYFEPSYFEKAFGDQGLRDFLLEKIALSDQKNLGLTCKIFNQQMDKANLELAKKEGYQGDDTNEARDYLSNQSYISVLKILSEAGELDLDENDIKEVLNIDTTNQTALEIRSQLINDIPNFIYDLMNGYKRHEFGAIMRAIANDGVDPEDLKDGLTTNLVHQIITAGSRIDIVNSRNAKGRTALHLAASECDLRALSHLVQLGAMVNAADSNGITPFHLVSKAYPEKNRRACMRSLLEHGADIDAKNIFGQTALHEAADSLETTSHYWDLEDREKYTKSTNKHLLCKQVHDLLKLGANLNVKNNCGDTPLGIIVSSIGEYSKKKGEVILSLVDHLITRGADIETKNDFGNTLLHEISSSIGKYSEKQSELAMSLMELLIKRGANIEARNAKGLTPLHLSLLSGEEPFSNPGRISYAEALLKQGANLKTTDNKGQTALHHAMCSPMSLLFGREIGSMTGAWLIKNGADVNAMDNEGNAPLHLMAEFADLIRPEALQSRLELVELLLKHGADVNAENIEGQTPLEQAEISDGASALLGRNSKMAAFKKLLLENGAKPTDN